MQEAYRVKFTIRDSHMQVVSQSDDFLLDSTKRVIPGFRKAVESLKKGQEVTTKIPPELAYGVQGQAPNVKGDETLTLTV